MQSASSQSLPKLKRLFVKPDMSWPSCTLVVGMVGSTKRAVAVDVHVLLVAVCIVVGGAAGLWLVTGAVVMK